jgi:hypothetical protein
MNAKITLYFSGLGTCQQLIDLQLDKCSFCFITDRVSNRLLPIGYCWDTISIIINSQFQTLKLINVQCIWEHRPRGVRAADTGSSRLQYTARAHTHTHTHTHTQRGLFQLFDLTRCTQPLWARSSVHAVYVLTALTPTSCAHACMPKHPPRFSADLTRPGKNAFANKRSNRLSKFEINLIPLPFTSLQSSIVYILRSLELGKCGETTQDFLSTNSSPSSVRHFAQRMPGCPHVPIRLAAYCGRSLFIGDFGPRKRLLHHHIKSVFGQINSGSLIEVKQRWVKLRNRRSRKFSRPKRGPIFGPVIITGSGRVSWQSRSRRGKCFVLCVFVSGVHVLGNQCLWTCEMSTKKSHIPWHVCLSIMIESGLLCVCMCIHVVGMCTILANNIYWKYF